VIETTTTTTTKKGNIRHTVFAGPILRDLKIPQGKVCMEKVRHSDLKDRNELNVLIHRAVFK